MSKDECPCKGCTAETGRAPGCHTAACPHGWSEWDQRHQTERVERRERVLSEMHADVVLTSGAMRMRRRKGRRSK